MTLAKLGATLPDGGTVERLTYSETEAAQVLGISRNTVRKLWESGQLASVRAGRRILIPKAALESFLAGK